MRIVLVLFLVTACNSSQFSTTASADKSFGESDMEAVGIIAEGLDYDGDPIVLKDPPPEQFKLYGDVESSWDANKVIARSGRHELNGTTRSEQITIKSLESPRQNVQSVSQVARVQYTNQYSQRGQNPNKVKESFTQANRGILDILLAIDNSGSMGNEIKQVRSNLSSLLTDIGNSNWQIAMVKSDPPSTCAAEGLITAKTSNYADAYKQLLTFQLQGGSEHMLKKARWALEGKSGTQCDGSWLRSGSTVAVIVVSDEPHQCPDNNVCSLSAYRSFVNAFAHDVTTYGFTVWNSTNQAIFAEHGSITGDYSSTLKKISANIQVNLKDIFTLKAKPDSNSLTVKVNNTAISSCSNTLTTNCHKVVSVAGGHALQFVGYKPPRNATIDVEYTYGSVPFDTEWTLTHDPLPDVKTMAVTVGKADGTSTTLVRGTHYTINGRVLRVTSNSVVPQGAAIRVVYLENKALKTSFTLNDSTGRLNVKGATLKSDTVRVIISGGSGNVVKKISSGFSFDGTTLTFTDKNTVPSPGIVDKLEPQKFTVTYNYLHGVETSYKYSLHSNHRAGSTLSCHNKTHNNSVSCQHDNTKNKVNFLDTIQFAVGDVIVITEQLRQQGNNLSLEGTGWIKDEVVQLGLAGRGTCNIPPSFITNDIVVLEDMEVSDCSLMQYLQPDTKQMVNFTYSVYDPETDPEAEDFLQMKKNFFHNNYGKYKFEYWEVMVNDVRTNKFEVEDYRVVLDDEVELGKNSIVKVKVYLYHAL